MRQSSGWFACAYGHALEFFELAEEVFDEMLPLVEFLVGRERLGCWEMTIFCAALVEVGDDVRYRRYRNDGRA